MKLLLKEIDKRLVVKLNRSIRTENQSGIMTYGANNDYPQIIERLILGSQTAKASASILAKFIAGAAFENEQIGNIKVGKDNKGKPVTLDSIRRDGAHSLAMYAGVFIHCNENLNKEVGTTKIVPFKNCRFSTEDANGYCGRVAVHPNWAKEQHLGYFKKSKISWYNNFNIDAIEDNVKQAGGIDKFKGQMYFLFLDNDYLYPLSPFDSVYLDMDTEYQVQLFKNRQIRNGFIDKAIILVDPPDDEKEKEKMKEELKSMMGPDGGSVVVLEATFDKETGELTANSTFKVEKIPTTINPRLFENWEQSLSNSIRKAANALPAVLIDYEQGQLSQASGEMLIQAENYYNAITRGLRETFSELFKDIYSHFADPVLKNNTNWKIKELSLFTNIKSNGTTSVIQPAAGNTADQQQ